jgi:hypothetical protein
MCCTSSYLQVHTFFLSHSSCCSLLEHRASVKLFVSLQFLDHFTGGRTPWTSDQLVARPLPKHRTIQTQNKHIHTPNIHALCGIRTHDPGFRASEDNSCLRPLGYRDRQVHACTEYRHALGFRYKKVLLYLYFFRNRKLLRILVLLLTPVGKQANRIKERLSQALRISKLQDWSYGA